MIGLTKRHRQSELMDAPDLNSQDHRQALIGLRRVNWWSGTAGILVTAIVREFAGITGRVKILDIASGGGDQVVEVTRRLVRQGLNVDVDGCDISSTAVAHATDHAVRCGFSQREDGRLVCPEGGSADGTIHFFQTDVLAVAPAAESYDVVMCTLFLHHLDEPQAMQLLNVMQKATRQLILVDDLRRTRLGYLLAWAGCRLLTRCRIVHVDGPLSVQGAFTDSEVRNLARQSGLDGIQLSTHWPQRFLLSWRKPTCVRKS